MRQPPTTRRSVLRGIGGAFATGAGLGVGTAAAQDDADGDDDADGASETAPEEEYTDLYEETIGSVVLVQVSGAGQPGEGGLGSGFVYDEAHVVTNAHVVGEATEVDLQFADERWRSATVVGTDRHSDLAVLAVEELPEGAEPLPLVEERPTVAQEVVALGNPLGLDASISAGIVSGVDRSLPSPTGFSIPAAIQTDAPLSPGNSGGPLVNLDGEVVGIVSAGAGPGFNVGFAISSELAERVVPSLIEDGEYEHPYLGVSVAPVTPSVAEANDLEEPGGVLVTRVVPDSPADGVLRGADDVTVGEEGPVPIGGDVIVEMGDGSEDPSSSETQSGDGGEEIPTEERLASYLALETSPGETIAVEVLRDGESETLEVTLGTRPDRG